MAYERIGPPMKAHEVMALKAAAGILRRYSYPGVVELLETLVRDEQAKRQRMRARA